MRDLKFRVWDIKEKEMKPVAGIVWHMGKVDDVSTGGIGYGVAHHELTEDFELMQFTGLRDKNGLEIYESDLVTVPNGSEGPVVTTVVWFEHGWGLRRNDNKETWHFRQWEYDEEGLFVVGNIYEK